jgi:hypothetical protein
MPSITGAAILGGGALSAGAGIGSALIGSSAAKDAASIQAAAALQASQNQMSMFGQIQSNLAPFTAAGQGAAGELQGLFSGGLQSPVYQALQGARLPSFASMFGTPQAEQSWLANTPGYQFVREQGLQATQNSYAAQGLGQSGAALKGAAQYAEGLAGTTFQQQFQNWLNASTQRFGQTLQGVQTAAGGLQNLFGVGESAGAMTGNLGVQSQTAANQLLTSGAAAQAAGVVGGANAITGGLGTVAGAGQNTALLYALNNAGMFGGQGSSNVGNLPASYPSDAVSNQYALSQGINPFIGGG